MAFNLQAERERRNALAKDTRNILDQNPGATWNDEHQKKYDENLAEIERIDAAIERHQKVMDLTAENNLRDAVSDVTKGDKATKDEAVRLFDKWCRGGDNALTPDEWTAVRNTMSTTTDSEGGYTVPTTVATSSLRDVELVLASALGAMLGEVLVDLDLLHPDARNHLAFAHALGHDLVAQPGAEARVVDALEAQPVAQLVGRQPVGRRHALHRAVELGIVDLDARLARIGRDHALVDQRIQRLPPQFVGCRRRHAAARGCGADAVHALLHLGRGHQVAVDHRHDEVAVVFGAADHHRRRVRRAARLELRPHRAQAEHRQSCEHHGTTVPAEFRLSHRGPLPGTHCDPAAAAGSRGYFPSGR